jgi:hypothetical protein
MYEIYLLENLDSYDILQIEDFMKIINDDGSDLLHPKTKGRIWYEAYLHTDHWKKLTAEYKLKFKFCCRCGDPVQVTHHKRYNAYNEKEEDLAPYCWECHRIIEAEKRLLAERGKR